MNPPPIPVTKKRSEAGVAVIVGIVILAVLGMIGGGSGNSGSSSATKSEPASPVAATERRMPNYITPTGPTKVIVHGVVACLDWEDHLSVEANKYGLEVDVPGLIRTNRCFDVPMGMMVTVVQRQKKPGGGYMNSVCIKPSDIRTNACVWTLIQRLDVRAE